MLERHTKKLWLFKCCWSGRHQYLWVLIGSRVGRWAIWSVGMVRVGVYGCVWLLASMHFMPHTLWVLIGSKVDGWAVWSGWIVRVSVWLLASMHLMLTTCKYALHATQSVCTHKCIVCLISLYPIQLAYRPAPWSVCVYSGEHQLWTPQRAMSLQWLTCGEDGTFLFLQSRMISMCVAHAFQCKAVLSGVCHGMH